LLSILILQFIEQQPHLCERLLTLQKHGCGRPIQQAMSNIGGNNPGTTHRATRNQKGDPEKGKEVCRALQMDRE